MKAKHKILVVDDDKDIVETIRGRLVREGYEVFTAFDGEEALVKAKEVLPDVIILDLMMPKLNGFEVLKEIRVAFKDKWIPVIIVSAQTELETLKTCYGLEADHYLIKPCDMEHILQSVETMISLIPFRKKEGD